MQNLLLQEDLHAVLLGQSGVLRAEGTPSWVSHQTAACESSRRLSWNPAERGRAAGVGKPFQTHAELNPSIIPAELSISICSLNQNEYASPSLNKLICHSVYFLVFENVFCYIALINQYLFWLFMADQAILCTVARTHDKIISLCQVWIIINFY